MSSAITSNTLLREDISNLDFLRVDINLDYLPSPINVPPNTPHAGAFASNGFGTPLACNQSAAAQVDNAAQNSFEQNTRNLSAAQPKGKKRFTFDIPDKEVDPTAVAVDALAAKNDK